MCLGNNGEIFENFKNDIIKRKIDFEIHKTNYTRKIKLPSGKIILFNETGEKDLLVLSMINKVKADAKKYLDISINNHYSSNKIYFFDLFDNPEKYDILYKVDLKAAYWTYALKKGIISEQTNSFFLESYKDKTYKQAKQARLKALGSLATTKHIIKYHKGIPDFEHETITTEPTKFLYMDICRGIDEIIRECIEEIEGCIYYYWDCIFVRGEFKDEVIEFFKNKQFDVGIGSTKIDYVPIGHGGYLLSQEFDSGKTKMYMVRKEKKHLLYT